MTEKSDLSDNSNSSNIKRNIFSDQPSKKIKLNKNTNKNLSFQIDNIPNPIDYSNKMDDDILFQKNSIQYIKNIILNGLSLKYKENKSFNFFEYVELFTKSVHNNNQFDLYKEIIDFKESISKRNYAHGEFDLIINGIKGSDLDNKIRTFNYNIYYCNKNNIDINKNYNIIVEIKKNIFENIDETEIYQQFKKYINIIKLLNSMPILSDIRQKLDIDVENQIIFAIATDGNYSNFDLMTKLLGYNKNYIDDSFNEKEYNNYSEKKFKIFKKLNFPVLLLFIPKIYDNKEFKPKYAKELEKRTIKLEQDLNKLQREIEELKKK